MCHLIYIYYYVWGMMGVEVTERGGEVRKKSAVSCDREYPTLNTIGCLVSSE